MDKGKLNIVAGCQYGSEGKGKIAGYLARNHEIHTSICSFSSQAGHSFVYDSGKKVIVQQVPMAAVNPDIRLLISQGAIIDTAILDREIDMFNLNEKKLGIHPKAIIILDEHKEYEANQLSGPKRIASTCKGNGAAMSDFVLRNTKVTTIDQLPKYAKFLVDTRAEINNTLAAGKTCLSECAQGFSLDIYQGYYPYVTSRGCTPMAELARIGVSHLYVGKVYGVYRTYPIRVGNIESDTGECVGYSGNCYEDQIELTWEDITKNSGSNEKLLERTTVTNRVRRVFSLSKKQFMQSINIAGITDVCMCFVDYINAEDYGKNTFIELSDKSKEFTSVIGNLCTEVKNGSLKSVRLSMLSTGPKESETIVFDYM